MHKITLMKSTLFFLSLIFTLTAAAQFHVGHKAAGPRKNKKISPEALEAVRNIERTVFVYGDQSTDFIEELKPMLKKAWTISGLEFKHIDNLDAQSADCGTSYIVFSGLASTKIYTGARKNSTGIDGWRNSYIHLTLQTCVDGERQDLARGELYPAFSTLNSVASKTDDLAYFYNDAEFYNWNPVILLNYVQVFNKYLTEGKPLWLFASNSDESALNKLKNETLYIPENTLIKFNKFTGNESKRHKEEELFKKYPFSYKVVSDDVLFDMVKNGESFYYLNYIKSSTDKYVSVLNGKTGEILYTDYSPMSYNIKSKDLKRLTKDIE